MDETTTLDWATFGLLAATAIGAVVAGIAGVFSANAATGALRLARDAQERLGWADLVLQRWDPARGVRIVNQGPGVARDVTISTEYGEYTGSMELGTLVLGDHVADTTALGWKDAGNIPLAPGVLKLDAKFRAEITWQDIRGEHHVGPEVLPQY